MITKLLKNILAFINKNISYKLGNSLLYIARTKKIPNYKNPRNFNDETMLLKFKYHKDQTVIDCTDKYEVRNYLEAKNCQEILNELYGVYEDISEIDFDKLPNKFVLKATHGCGYNIVCNDKSKLDIEKTKEKLNKWMNESYGWPTGELHYTKIKPRIICEKNLVDKKGNLPVDYKVYCFHGKVVGFLICTERDEELKLNFYDEKWIEKDYIKDYEKGTKKIKKIECYDEIIKYAEILSQDFEFVRVDFYYSEKKVIFGELTFTPACCCAPYYNDKGNKELFEIYKEGKK